MVTTKNGVAIDVDRLGNAHLGGRLSAIAAALELTRERVRQLYEEMLAKLRGRLQLTWPRAKRFVC